MTPRFGTDGVRGPAGTVITEELAWSLGNALVGALGPDIWLARDTRRSGPALLAAAVAGVRAAGGRATTLGVLPTPALSARVRDERADAGIMVTASHNPPGDNGMKVLARGGGKLDRGTLGRLEAAMATPVRAEGGTSREVPGTEAYVEGLLRALPPGRWLEGVHVLFDGAMGAATEVGPLVLDRLGARVRTFVGEDVNTGCGAVHPEFAAHARRAEAAERVLAVDGDGDRIALVDTHGRLLDGDAILWLCRRGPTMVGTVMTNLRLERALGREGIGLVRTAVGDANVAAAMLAGGHAVGGEPSGHLLFAEGPPTADALYAGLRALHRSPDLDTTGYAPCAQAHAAVRDVRSVPLDLAFVEAAGARAVVRPSGTEPVVRVMIEHDDPAVATALRDRVVALLRAGQ
jgi:phosphoglucosamine mutase